MLIIKAVEAGRSVRGFPGYFRQCGAASTEGGKAAELVTLFLPRR